MDIEDCCPNCRSDVLLLLEVNVEDGYEVYKCLDCGEEFTLEYDEEYN